MVPMPDSEPAATVNGQASEPLTIKAPSQFVTVPLNGFAPETVSVPELDLAMLIVLALPFWSDPESTKFPAPWNVNVRVPVAELLAEIVPPKFNVPASD